MMKSQVALELRAVLWASGRASWICCEGHIIEIRLAASVDPGHHITGYLYTMLSCFCRFRGNFGAILLSTLFPLVSYPFSSD
jgi:hypothetical protein